MNSLVGYGVSSDSDSDLEEGNNNTSGSAGKEDDEEAVKKTRNFLLESASASSDSESEDEEPQLLSTSSYSHPHAPPAPFRQPTLPAPPALHPNKLPSPPLNACSDSSVFTNPFKAQADQRLSALQKHVPLTMQAQPSQIGGKRMCVSYRKDGRCRFGIKCKFAHDSDLQTPVVPTDSRPAEGEGTPEDGPGAGGGSQSHQQETKEDESEGQHVKKRRVGLSNTLIPPKRAMKQYSMQRERERINMS